MTYRESIHEAYRLLREHNHAIPDEHLDRMKADLLKAAKDVADDLLPKNQEKAMNKLSTGQDATLGNYRKLTAIFFGENSRATAFLDKKIAESPNGENEEVVAEESQMLYLLNEIHCGRAEAF